MVADKNGVQGNEATYEDRMGVLVFTIGGHGSIQEFVASPVHKAWLDTGDVPDEPFQGTLGTAVFVDMNEQAEMLARHRMVTTAALREQTWAAKKAFTKVMALVAQLGNKRRGPGLSPADKMLLEKLGEIAGLLEDAGMSE